MKAIQLVGTSFPRVRYAFMSKIKPNSEQYILESTENRGFFTKKFYDFITQRDLRILKSKMNENNQKEIEEMLEKKEVPPEKSPTFGYMFKENLNFVIVCNDFKKWVKQNAKMNPNHSFFYRNKFTLRLLKYLCCRNNFIHTCRFENEQYNVSYHVIDIDKFKGSLTEWNNYQVASLLQRPYHELVADERMEQYKKKNLINAIAFNCLVLMENEDSQFLAVDELTFFHYLANFPGLVPDFEPELDAAMHDHVNKKNISEYHKLYKEALLDSPLKDICQYNSKKKQFLINNSVKARETLFKNLPYGLKPHFWALGKMKIMGKKYTNPLIEDPAFMKDFIYLASRDSAENYKFLLSYCIANVSNVRSETLMNLKRKFAWNLFLFFGSFFFVFGLLDSIREYLRVERRLFDDLEKENLDLIEFNLVDREPVASGDSGEIQKNNTNALSAEQKTEVNI